MSALDIFVIVLLGGGAIIGFVRGLVHEMLSLLAWVVAIVMLRLFHTPITVSLTETAGSATAAAVLAFVILFLPSFLFMKLLARWDRQPRSVRRLSSTNRDTWTQSSRVQSIFSL